MRKKKQNEIVTEPVATNGMAAAPVKSKAVAKPRATKNSVAKTAAAKAAADEAVAEKTADTRVEKAAAASATSDLTSESVIAANAMEHDGTPDLGPLAEALADHESVALRAYFRWLEHGCPPGSAEQDWLEAERQLQDV